MKILIVSNEYSRNSRVGNPIVERMVQSTSNDNRVETAFFIPFTNRFSDLYKIRKRLQEGDIDIFHIHFGGLYALIIYLSLLGVKIPRVITFHGTDLHAGEISTTKSFFIKIKIRLNRAASLLSIFLFDRVGVVSESLIEFIPTSIYKHCSQKLFVQHLGVDYNLFKIVGSNEARKKLEIPDGKYLLFSDKSNSPIKRKDIADAIMSLLENYDYKMLIMNGVDPTKVPLYINSCEAILLTSDMEGSPNIVREALALNKRVFSVDVGDVKKQIEGLVNSCIISRDPVEASCKIKRCLDTPYTDNTRDNLRDRLDISRLTSKIVDIYLDLI